MDRKSLGTIKPGETKELELMMPEGLRTGDEAWFKIEWTCGGCGRERTQIFHTVVGSSKRFDFGCDCVPPKRTISETISYWTMPICATIIFTTFFGSHRMRMLAMFLNLQLSIHAGWCMYKLHKLYKKAKAEFEALLKEHEQNKP